MILLLVEVLGVSGKLGRLIGVLALAIELPILEVAFIGDPHIPPV